MIDGYKGQNGFRTLVKSQDEVIVHTLNKQCFSAGFFFRSQILHTWKQHEKWFQIVTLVPSLS